MAALNSRVKPMFSRIFKSGRYIDKWIGRYETHGK